MTLSFPRLEKSENNHDKKNPCRSHHSYAYLPVSERFELENCTVVIDSNNVCLRCGIS
jgi:hypothetical protein